MISIIIPVYNKVNTVEKLIVALTTQIENHCVVSGKNPMDILEVIVVDDKSTDDTVNVIKEVLKPYIRLIESKENGGPSKARNYGIEAAKGEHILFIDADDSIDESYLTTVFKECQNESDFTVFSFSEDYLDENENISHRLERVIDDGEYQFDNDKDSFCETIISLEEKTMLGYPWNKIYKKEIFDRFEIRFPEELRFGEDIFFNCSYLTHVNSVRTISKQLYRYNNYSGARLTSGVVKDYFEIQRNRVEELKRLFEKWDCLNEHAKNVLASEYFRSLTSEMARQFRQKKSEEEVRKICEEAYESEIYKLLKDYLPNGGIKKKILYTPLIKRKTGSAIRRAKMIVFLQTKLPMFFSKAKGKV